MNIYSLLRYAVEHHPDKIAVVDGVTRLTYDEVGERVNTLAHFLQSKDIKPGDRISILDVNSHHFYEAYFAAAGLGAILNPLNVRLAPRELAYIVADAEPRWLLVAPQFAPNISSLFKSQSSLGGILWLGKTPNLKSDIPSFEYGKIISAKKCFEPVDLQSDDIAHLYYTSGTTGKPKGVPLTHRNVCIHAKGSIEELSLTENDVWGHIAPMFHLADAWATFAITRVGGCHVMLPSFAAESALRLIQNENITISNLIPTMLNLMVKCPEVDNYDLSSLRVILSGGAPIAIDVVRRVIDTFGCDYVQTYGMTETSPYLTLSLLKDHLKKLPPEEQLIYKAKTGRPFKAVKLKVMRDDGISEVQPDDHEVGEIWVRGDTITPGYWNRADETEEAFEDGWLKTGDLAVVDRDGYVNIVDRKKDMIISGGENIYSIEVESVLYEHPQVMEAAVIGIPDEIWGEVIMAAVVVKSGEKVSEDKLKEFCRERLTGFKVPQSIVFLPELPKTGSGKVSKKKLKDMY